MKCTVSKVPKTTEPFGAGPFFANSANDHWVQLCWSSSRAHKLHILQSSTLKREDATSSASSFFCCFYCETHFKWRSWDDDVIKYNISLCSKNKVGSHQGRGTFLKKSSTSSKTFLKAKDNSFVLSHVFILEEDKQLFVTKQLFCPF